MMRIDPSGWPFIGGGVVCAVVALAVGGLTLGIVLLLLPAFFVFFFRDPERMHHASPDAVIAPADGRVLVAGAPTGHGAPAGAATQISIFLSPIDVHVNRLPVSGRVTRVKYHPGRFLPAYRREAGDLNEHTEITIDHGGQDIVVRQVVGLLARRVVCRVSEGADVKAGDRFGVMKFGSRMDVFLPAGATLHSHVGDHVVGGVTVMATLSPVTGNRDERILESVDAP
jgi:phosphatidylserine decarboxylase